MADLFDMLTQQLKGQAAEQIGRQFGMDGSSVEKAVPGALSALLGGLAGNAKSSQGASALASALDKDHDGSVLDDLGGFLGQQNTGGGAGAAILGHIFGGRQGQVEQQLGQSAGLDSRATSQLLAMLAPIVMGALGKAKRSNGLGVSDLAGMLQQERSGIEQKAPSAFGPLAGLLDADGDGDIKDDLTRLGGGLLKNLLK